MATSGSGVVVDDEELKLNFTKLKKSIADVLEEDPQYDDDWFLFPFLKTHLFNVEKAASMIRESIKWRKEINFQKLASKPYNAGIAEALPIHTDGVTKTGIPVATVTVGGEVDHRWIVEKYGRDRYLRYFLQFFAKSEHLALEEVKKSQPTMTKDSRIGMVVICDVGNYSLSQAKSLSVIQTWVEVTQNYNRYSPGLASSLYILNMNRIFGPVFKMIKPWMEGPCLEIHLFDDGDVTWKEKILEAIEPDQIRPEYGGTKKNSDE